MNTIIVDPTSLENVASRIDAKRSDYERTYQNLYAEVDKLSSSWQGKDNMEFTNRIRSYQMDFREISIILNQYADFLRHSARAYRESQDELYNNASKLNAGGR